MNAKTKIANCDVLASECTGSEGWLKVATPFELKKSELADNKLVNPDENPARAREVNRRRIEKTESVKPV